MRDVPTDVLSNLQQNHGIEPVLIIEVQWVAGGPLVLYSDQKLSGAEYPYPSIIQVGNFDAAMQVDGAGDSQQISIVLNDVDGALKTLIDENDILLHIVNHNHQLVHIIVESSNVLRCWHAS